jgi:hypothetical protein
MDFFRICTKEARGKENKGTVEVYADFIVGRSKDLMVRGKAFYAIWDEEKGLWSVDDLDVQRLVDAELYKHAEQLTADGVQCTVKTLSSFDTNRWALFRKYLTNLSDSSHDLDGTVTFANTPVKKSDYASRRLPYSLAPGDISAYDELVSHLYDPEERAKFEWAFGAILCGAAKNIEKFLVFYGPGGTGKSTVMKIAEMMFGGLSEEGGYVAIFDAKALVGNNNAFSTAPFRSNPLIAIQHDGDLSNIKDNTALNSIISHESLMINEKYKPTYPSRINSMLIMGTNSPVKITDAKSGIIRRLIDVNPSLRTFSPDHYYSLMARIEFELGAIAQHCLDTYKRMGKNAYSEYRSTSMRFETDPFYNFIDWYFDIFKYQNGATLEQAYNLYKEYCSESGNEKPVQRYKFRDALKDYFDEFHDRYILEGRPVRSYYSGFKAEPFKAPVNSPAEPSRLLMESTVSIFDRECAAQPAQYANEKESPGLYWTDEERLINGVMRKPKPHQIVSTVLSDLDTTKLHFVKVPENHIVIDFDLTDENGDKSLERNLEAASGWPATYAEVSKSGSGVHLHYLYAGSDVGELAAQYSDGIEIKSYRGNASLRRQLTVCNTHTISTISSGLPFKEKKVLNTKVLGTEKSLRELIARNLRKEIHPGTKPSIDFIEKILSDAYRDGMVYDVTDLRPRIMAFANNSRNQATTCLKAVQRMRFKSETDIDTLSGVGVVPDDGRIVFFDIEVFPNLMLVCWKYRGEDVVVRMINPEPHEIEGLFKLKLVGFNNRGYDNHILWARYMGASLAEIYERSRRIVGKGGLDARFPEAYNLSFADIYDFASVKMGLKKWEIKLGIRHMELDLPWDEPAPEELWPKIEEYCVNDLFATEKVFEALQQDWIARQILADLSGLTENDTNRKHAINIIFGKETRPQSSFNYVDLGDEFPGYRYDFGVSTYRGEEVGEGGYVYAEPGMYENVALLDVASMHPSSIKALDAFGPYTKKFVELMDARLDLKHAMEAIDKGYDAPTIESHLMSAGQRFNGKLAPFIKGELNVDNQDSMDSMKIQLKGLSDALKLVINSVYGLSAATFENPFRDIRNKDNFIAKRGALFMIDLKYAVQERGFQVAHIKTDSIKIPNATPELIQFVTEFGKKYGYDFDHEATYKKFCLVNDAVFIAQVEGKRGKPDYWKATGAQFQHPYVFKTLFTHDPITFKDLCETKEVTKPAAIYLDFDAVHKPMASYSKDKRHFVGRTGLFTPVHAEAGGGILLRVQDEQEHSVGGTKDYFWVESNQLERLPENDQMEAIDMSYFERLVDKAKENIGKFGDFEAFVSST